MNKGKQKWIIGYTIPKMAFIKSLDNFGKKRLSGLVLLKEKSTSNQKKTKKILIKL